MTVINLGPNRQFITSGAPQTMESTASVGLNTYIQKTSRLRLLIKNSATRPESSPSREQERAPGLLTAFGTIAILPTARRCSTDRQPPGATVAPQQATLNALANVVFLRQRR
jgi:hypothetical protein